MSIIEKETLINQINQALDGIRPHLAVDGGDVEVMDVTEDMDVIVKWLGNCQLCAMSDMTMKAGIEQTIKAQLPQINNVVAINSTQ
jgi:Fe-S cluster biogenesis protein NfuA